MGIALDVEEVAGCLSGLAFLCQRRGCFAALAMTAAMLCPVSYRTPPSQRRQQLKPCICCRFRAFEPPSPEHPDSAAAIYVPEVPSPPMPTPFTSQDLSRIFDARVLTRGRGLGLAGGVDVQLDGDTITATVQDRAFSYNVRITPSLFGRRVVFDHHCTCRVPGCAHLAATGFAALDRFPGLRKPEQQTFLDTLAAPPEKERQRIVFELAPAEPPHACVVTTILIGERTFTAAPTTPLRIANDEQADPKLRDLAYLIGEGNETRTGVAATLVVDLLDALIESGHARWHAGGKRLIKGETRFFEIGRAHV